MPHRALLTRATGLPVVPLALAASIVGAEVVRVRGVIRLRDALALYALGLGVALLRGRQRRWPARGVFGALGVAAISLVLPIGTAVTRGAPDAYALLAACCPMLAAWIVTLLLAGTSDATPPPPAAPGADGRVLAWLTLGTFVTALAWLVVWRWGHEYAANVDETIYVLQSRWLRLPGAGLTPGLDTPEVALEFTFVNGGRTFGQYPLGWPAVLAVFDVLGALPLAPAVLGATSVVLTVRVGARAFGIATGVAAGITLLTHPWFLDLHRGYSSHALTLCLILAAIVLAHDGVPRGARAKLLLSGFAMGLTIAARPLTGVAAVAAAMVAAWLFRLRAGRGAWGTFAWIIVGAVAPIAGMLWYNRAATGDVLTFGYSYLHGDLHDMGFGLRGFRGGQLLMFTPELALSTAWRRVTELLRDSVGFALLLPTLGVALLAGGRVPWRWFPPLVAVPVAYAGFFFSQARFYLDVVPWLILAWAGATTILTSRTTRTAGLLLVLGAVGHALTPPPRTDATKLRRNSPSAQQAMRELAARTRSDRLLVLLRTADLVGNTGPSFYLLQEYGTDPRALVVAYTDSTYHAIRQRYPARTAVTVRIDGAEELVRLDWGETGTP